MSKPLLHVLSVQSRPENVRHVFTNILSCKREKDSLEKNQARGQDLRSRASSATADDELLGLVGWAAADITKSPSVSSGHIPITLLGKTSVQLDVDVSDIRLRASVQYVF